MFQFILGFVSGIYIGTNYECTPLITRMETLFKQYFPKKDSKQEPKQEPKTETIWDRIRKI